MTLSLSTAARHLDECLSSALRGISALISSESLNPRAIAFPPAIRAPCSGELEPPRDNSPAAELEYRYRDSRDPLTLHYRDRSRALITRAFNGSVDCDPVALPSQRLTPPFKAAIARSVRSEGSMLMKPRGVRSTPRPLPKRRQPRLR